MSDGGYTDLGTTDYSSGGYTDIWSGDTSWLDPITVTPPVTLSDYNSAQTGNDWSGILSLISGIGSTFASTYNAVNHPSYPSAYQQPGPQPQGSTDGGNAPSSAAPSFMSHLTDFNSPYPYVAIGGVLVLVMLMKRR